MTHEKDPILALSDKEKITIVITDSGLGGLSICADIAKRLKDHPIFPEVSVIYFNAWPEQNRGYNRLKDTAERIRVFDRALMGMKQFNPDLIMIACNTLSVLYSQTRFSGKNHIPVIDIVGFGVDLIHRSLSGSATAKAVILGTLTTIWSRTHERLLLAKGVASRQVATQACDQLATEIEKGPGSSAVESLIETYMKQAAEKMGSGHTRVFAALCCTHFGYCKDLIQKHLEDHLGKTVGILDPNQEMGAFLFKSGRCSHTRDTALTLRVVSKIAWNDKKIDAISGRIENISVKTADALRNYSHMPDLFTF